MPRRATVKLQPLQTCLVNLPIGIYGQLVSKSIKPQSLVVCLSVNGPATKEQSELKDAQRSYVGWSGMPSQVVGGIAGISRGEEVVEIDPTFAKELHMVEGTEASFVPTTPSWILISGFLGCY